ncbi:MAG: hypothetical protein H6Q49_273 [Deltaproteobacteria bacterium]|nr:hypothetical protein [Deltaproteobacteria bacterium]
MKVDILRIAARQVLEVRHRFRKCRPPEQILSDFQRRIMISQQK